MNETDCLGSIMEILTQQVMEERVRKNDQVGNTYSAEEDKTRRDT